jgi:eukaryotic-like serine/threonine-protein kinase
LPWFDRQGREVPAVGRPPDYGDFALDPDGRRVVTHTRQATQVAIVDLATGSLTPVTFNAQRVTQPCWSSDGRFVAYASNRWGMFDILLVPTTGGGSEEVLVYGTATNWSDSFSPDGRFLFHESSDPVTQYDLWYVRPDGDRHPQSFLRTNATETHAFLSPNGRWLAYTSDMSGRAEVYVRAFSSGEGPWQVSTEGGDQALWRRDGKELFFVSPDRTLMVAGIHDAGGVFRAAAPQRLFQARLRTPGILAVRNDSVVSADGQRFLINKVSDDPAKATITVVVNWCAALKR